MLGSQWVGIVSDTPVLDGGGQPVRDAAHDIVMADEPSVVWKNRCLIEVQESALPARAEIVTDTSTTIKEVAWIFLPVDDDTRVITWEMRLRDGGAGTAPVAGGIGDDYKMRGNGVVETSKRGRADHIFCLAERQGG